MTIPDDHAATVLRQVHMLARQQWKQDGHCYDLAEYEDAGLDAIASCVERYDPHRGVQFTTYAAYRINGAIRDATQTYRAWHHGHKGPGASAPPRAEVLRPLAGPQPDPVLRTRLLREIPTLSPRDGALLVRLLAGEDICTIAEAEGQAYITIYKRYRHLLHTLRQRFGPPA